MPRHFCNLACQVILKMLEFFGQSVASVVQRCTLVNKTSSMTTNECFWWVRNFVTARLEGFATAVTSAPGRIFKHCFWRRIMCFWRQSILMIAVMRATELVIVTKALLLRLRTKQYLCRTCRRGWQVPYTWIVANGCCRRFFDIMWARFIDSSVQYLTKFSAIWTTGLVLDSTVWKVSALAALGRTRLCIWTSDSVGARPDRITLPSIYSRTLKNADLSLLFLFK